MAPWNLNNKKWIYWLGFAGFILSFNFLFWMVAVIIFLAFDKEKPKTKDYQVDRVFEKFMIITGFLAYIYVPLYYIFLFSI